MVSLDLKNNKKYLIIGLIFAFTLFALWLRLIPMFNKGNTDILLLVGSDDPLYNLRQVEQILANFPAYNWFDVMTKYPTGSSIYWGPLFPTIIAACCIITGAAIRPEVISTGLLVPPLMGAAMIPIMYYVGKTCGNWKTGLLASGFTAIVSGQFFYRSYYGYMDHHIAEVLFSTIFCLCYIYALLSVKKTTINLKSFETFKKPLLLSVLAGIAYLLGLFTMPTMILFAMIVGIFTVIQFVIDVYRGRSSEYLLMVNTTIFVIAILGLLIFGFKGTGIDLSNYSVGHIYAYVVLIGGTGVLYFLATSLKGRERYYYPAAIVACAVVFAAVLFIISPPIYNLLITSFFSFFGQQAITNTVQEARAWTPELAWLTFNYGLLLMVGGALVLIYNNMRDEHPEQVFTLVWSLVMLYATWQHIRYEYYLAVNIALLSAVCIGFSLEQGWRDIHRLANSVSSETDAVDKGRKEKDDIPKTKKQKKAQKKSGKSPQKPEYLYIALVVVAVGLGILFSYTSASLSYSNANSYAPRMNGDWRESLDWLGNNTPDTGVNYFKIYDEKTFRYPIESYGVMSWWDYGHMITYISKRIPNANPFQQGVAGSNGSAAYFVSTDEETANSILDNLGTRYVITDIEMDTGKFWAMATWYNTTAAIAPFQKYLLAPAQDASQGYQQVLLNDQPYYLTMVSRLHNFDGSMTKPTSVYYIEYAEPSITQVSLPVITNAEAMNATEAVHRAEQFNLKAPEGYHAVAMSPVIVLPIETVPALRHYRLVHESPTNIFTGKTPDVKYVKVFEYVKGAHIKGDGIIELPLVTNTGRQLTYRQASINGEFIVPYSTTGNPYGVKATGKYRISGTGQEFDVPENAVMQSATIR